MDIRIERKAGVVTVHIDGYEYLRLEDYGNGLKVAASACLPVDAAKATEIARAYVVAFDLANASDERSGVSLGGSQD